MSPATSARRRAIRSLITSADIASQQQIVDALANRGYEVTQATVSRDLDAIGGNKVRRGDGSYRYVIREEEPVPGTTQAAARAVAEYVQSIRVSGDLVVLHTPPGAAHLVAGAIDRSWLDGVLGTIAGDDTLLVVAEAEPGGAAVADLLERLGGR